MWVSASVTVDQSLGRAAWCSLFIAIPCKQRTALLGPGRVRPCCGCACFSPFFLCSPHLRSSPYAVVLPLLPRHLCRVPPCIPGSTDSPRHGPRRRPARSSQRGGVPAPPQRRLDATTPP
ncbi:hypothetical protein BU14_2290s0002 [Porphyra umbilicalis]|uniref:Uncharacterized protein n=1 Tax=Porphyra umbilicalis TaxID=2786 RepID=A0A1X6NK69_PORUM|nr:hypothetical protein BU14_2290s0002 [Porphyra umbilicalis]|eukprot:OSX68753.1 hypothetical protein BU14_2290s0002 [Porphyra umbilicalis]